MALRAASTVDSGMYHRLADHMDLVREHFSTIVAIKAGIASGDLWQAIEAWHELGDWTKRKLWLSAEAHGIWQPHEREAMRSNEWNALLKKEEQQ